MDRFRLDNGKFDIVDMLWNGEDGRGTARAARISRVKERKGHERIIKVTRLERKQRIEDDDDDKDGYNLAFGSSKVGSPLSRPGSIARKSCWSVPDRCCSPYEDK